MTPGRYVGVTPAAIQPLLHNESSVMMSIIVVLSSFGSTISDMKERESVSLTPDQLNECKELGARISRLRKARGVLQSEGALRAGISRPTAVRIEAGDPGRTLGQLLRYLQAIVPEMTLAQLIQGKDPSLMALEESEQTKRVRRLSEKELRELDF